jgi:photosynthetic reaction center cytochrome c subunit
MRLLSTVLFLATTLVLAQDPPPQKKGGGGGGGMPHKNLKVLKDSPDIARVTMREYTVALGVQCTHCHVMGQWEKDDLPKKDVARTMIKMVNDVNSALGADAAKAKVTCYTCHRGKLAPETAPPPAQ